MRILATCLLGIFIGLHAHGDSMDWRISVTCDANAREARVEMVRCDANSTSADSCNPQLPTVSADMRVAKTDSNADRQLITPYRSLVRSSKDEPIHVSLVKNSPAEFGCRIPNKEDNQFTGKDASIFIRIERYPSNFNYQGRCGAGPYQAELWIQTETTFLDLERPVQKVQLAGYCGWGDPGPISTVTINADTGVVETTPYTDDIE